MSEAAQPEAVRPEAVRPEAVRPEAVRPDAGGDLDLLREERDFLLRSLDDLEAERAAGDVDEHDYVVLRDDYTARAARVLRAIEAAGEVDDRAGADDAPAGPVAPSAAAPPVPTHRRGRGLVWAAGVVAFAVLAGVLVARMSGRRGAGDLGTGMGGRADSASLSSAQAKFRAGDAPGAIAVLDKLIAKNPEDDVALAQRAWFVYLGDSNAGPAREALTKAVDLNPDNAQARVFRAFVNNADGKVTEAASDLAAFDASTSASITLLDTVDNMQLRTKVGEAALTRVRPALLDVPVAAPTADTIAKAGLTVAEVRYAAESLSLGNQYVDALRLYQDVLAASPRDGRAWAYLGWSWIIAATKTKDTSFLANANDALDRAVVLAPFPPETHVFRSLALLLAGRNADARAELDAFDRGVKPAAVVQLVGDLGLRDLLSASPSASPSTTSPSTTAAAR